MSGPDEAMIMVENPYIYLTGYLIMDILFTFKYTVLIL